MVKEIEALHRGLQVYQLLQRDGAAGLSDIARECGLSKATALRILATLASAGFARQRRTDRMWQVAGLPGQSERYEKLATVAGPVLDDFCQRVLWPSDVGVYENGFIRVLETSRSLSPFLVNRDVLMQRIHVLPSAMGRAILAWSSEKRRESIIAELAASGEPHDKPAKDPAFVARIVAASASRGYARRNTGYFISVPREAKVTAVAVPIIVDGEALAAVNLSWVTGAVSDEDFEQHLLHPLRKAAQTIALRLNESGAG